ncbi:oligoribonuclease [Glutamicibacter ardleyensis]|uniref:oligoribonuclease n=1 Tax=Glutamicibacter ardleyensis TaxID=225894 RepID=UPI003FD50FF6
MMTETKELQTPMQASACKDANNLIWADFETTGLPETAGFEPLEVAVVVTDPTATKVLWESGSLAISPKNFKQALASMVELVREMHTKTDLIGRLERGEGLPLDMVEEFLVSNIAPFFPCKGEGMPDGTKYRGAVLAGNSVHFDREVVRRFFPQLDRQMTHRLLDVSSIENMVCRSFPAVQEALEPKTSDHTASHDIAESIRQYRHYTQAFSGA